MADWSVTGIGGNVRAASFEGAALNMARMLNLPTEITDFFIKQHKELTSPLPVIPEMSRGIQGGLSVSEATAPQVPTNLSQGGLSLA